MLELGEEEGNAFMVLLKTAACYKSAADGDQKEAAARVVCPTCFS
jgi:hypothetical protein